MVMDDENNGEDDEEADEDDDNDHDGDDEVDVFFMLWYASKKSHELEAYIIRSRRPPPTPRHRGFIHTPPPRIQRQCATAD